MSSNYEVLCLSHDPAISATDRRSSPEEAVALASRDGEHQHCDLLVARYSGGLVELGCPPAPGKDRRCCHSTTEWVDAIWLRLLIAATHGEPSPAVAAAAERVPLCWTTQRLDRVAHLLDVEGT